MNSAKDAGKAAPFPLWETFLARRATVRAQEAAQELRWAFEELHQHGHALPHAPPPTYLGARLQAQGNRKGPPDSNGLSR